MKGGRLFTKDFSLAFVISVCCSLNYFAILINITAFGITTFGATEAEAGLSAGMYVIGGLFSRLFLGKYIELVGRRRMLILGLGFSLVMSAFYFLVSSMAMLYAVRLLHGIGYGIASTCTTDIAAKLLPPERRGEGLGYFALAITLGTAIGPYLCLVLSPDYVAVFAIGLAMYSTSVACALLMKVPEEVLTEEQRREARSFTLDNILQISALPLGFTAMVFFFGYSGILSFIDLYSEEIGMVEAASYFYLAVSAGTLVSRLTTGKVFDSRGPNAIITLGFACFVAGMVVFSRTDAPLVFLGTGFLMGYGMSIVYAVCQAAAIAMSPPHRYGVTTSTFAAVTDLGTGFGPTFLGFLIPLWGFRDMYLACAFIGLMALALYWLVHGRRSCGIR